MSSPRAVVSPRLSSRRLALLSGLALMSVLGAVSICNADSPGRRPFRPPPPPPYRVTLEDAYGSPLPSFRKGESRFVLGEPGQRYSVRVENPTAERVEVVLTVDGRDAVSGEVGDYVVSRGYLVEAYGSLVVEGFRRSLEEVAAFRFTEREHSYSSLRGTPRNVGVIGVAVFPEKARPRGALVRPKPRPTYEAERAEASPRGGAARSKSGPSNIGTSYGEERSSSVVEVAFERRSPTHPAAVLSVRYDDLDGLIARGIDVSSLGYAAYRDEPEPFPQNRRRFAPPPPR